MAKSTALANAETDAEFNGGASGTVTIGALALTLPFKCKFMSTVGSAGTPGTDWSTAGGYTAGGVSLSGLFSTPAASGSKANTGAISVVNAPAGTWAANEITDSNGTPNRLNFAAITGGSKTVNSGDTCTIAAGGLVGSNS